MKRDMELARQILQQVEEKSNGLGCGELDLPGYSENAVSYHVMLLKEAGLLEAHDLSNTEQGLFFAPVRLTWQGHEFFSAVQNETVWSKVNATVKEKGGAIPFEVLKALAIKLAMSVFGL